MIVVFAVAAVLVIGLAAALAFGLVSGLSVHSGTLVTSSGGRALPDGPLHGEDLDRLSFGIAMRGYRMDEVDAALTRLRERITELEDELDEAGAASFARIRVEPVEHTEPVGAGEDDTVAELWARRAAPPDTGAPPVVIPPRETDAP